MFDKGSIESQKEDRKYQKTRYLKNREKTIGQMSDSALNVINYIFDMAEPLEDYLNKDCSTFTIQEIKDLYSSILSRSANSLRTLNAQLNQYTAWCISQNLVPGNQNNYAILTLEDLKNSLNQKLVDSMVISRKELEKTIDLFDNVSDAFLCLAIFEGLGGLKFSDFHGLTMDNFDGNIVKLQHRQLKVSSKLIALAEDSSKTFAKYGNEKVLKHGYKISDPCIIKYSSNAQKEPSVEFTQRMIQTRLYRLEEDYGMAFSYAGLRNSGRIDYIKKLMKKAGDATLDYSKLITSHREEIENRYGSLQSVSRWLSENEKYLLS